MEKICSNCHILQPHTNYYKNDKTSDGYQSWCKKCLIDYGTEWSKENKERRNHTIRRKRTAERTLREVT